jgi:hypothetical protein
MKKALMAAAAVTLGLAVLAGCSSDDNSSSTSTTKSATSKDAVCSARSKLKKNLKSLESPSLLTEGKSGIESELNGLGKDLDSLTSAAKTDYQPQVDAVKSSIDDLKTAIKDVGSGSLTDNIQAVQGGHKGGEHHRDAARPGQGQLSVELALRPTNGILDTEGNEKYARLTPELARDNREGLDRGVRRRGHRSQL